jgi:mono/diheme cytochrome c family protein
LGAEMPIHRLALGLALGLVLGTAVLALMVGPAAAQDHQYSAEQIQAGYRIYVGQCQLCHGFNGDGIARVSLSRQQFPRAVTDDDIRKAITTGNPAGMPPFALKADELDGLVAFIRSGILTSLTDPSKGTMPINRAVTIVTTDGRTIAGRRFNEDTFSVQLIDAKENILSIQKTDIRRYDVSMTSQMPSYKGRLKDTDLADLLAYLVSLRGK